ncbi:MAG: cohesin domain-containing protein [Pyrinomonadaceae bacterium]
MNNRSFLRGAKFVFAMQMTLTLLLMLCPSTVRTQTARKRTSSNAPATSREQSGSSRADSQATQAQPELAILTITAPFTSTTVGANFTIPATCGDTTGLGIVSWQFDLVFNPSVIVPQMNPISTAGTISDGMAFFTNVVGGNTLKVVFFAASNRVGGGVLFNFKFTAVGPLGSTSPLTWVNFMWNEGNPGANAVPGQVLIVGPTAANSSIRGRLVSPVGQAVPYTHVTLTDSHGIVRTALSNPFGYFEFTEVASGQSYVIGAETRRFVFAPRIIEVGSDLIDLEIVAEP